MDGGTTGTEGTSSIPGERGLDTTPPDKNELTVADMNAIKEHINFYGSRPIVEAPIPVTNKGSSSVVLNTPKVQTCNLTSGEQAMVAPPQERNSEIQNVTVRSLAMSNRNSHTVNKQRCISPITSQGPTLAVGNVDNVHECFYATEVVVESSSVQESPPDVSTGENQVPPQTQALDAALDVSNRESVALSNMRTEIESPILTCDIAGIVPKMSTGTSSGRNIVSSNITDKFIPVEPTISHTTSAYDLLSLRSKVSIVSPIEGTGGVCAKKSAYDLLRLRSKVPRRSSVGGTGSVWTRKRKSAYDLSLHSNVPPVSSTVGTGSISTGKRKVSLYKKTGAKKPKITDIRVPRTPVCDLSATQGKNSTTAPRQVQGLCPTVQGASPRYVAIVHGEADPHSQNRKSVDPSTNPSGRIAKSPMPTAKSNSSNLELVIPGVQGRDHTLLKQPMGPQQHVGHGKTPNVTYKSVNSESNGGNNLVASAHSPLSNERSNLVPLPLFVNSFPRHSTDMPIASVSNPFSTARKLVVTPEGQASSKNQKGEASTGGISELLAACLGFSRNNLVPPEEAEMSALARERIATPSVRKKPKLTKVCVTHGQENQDGSIDGNDVTNPTLHGTTNGDNGTSNDMQDGSSQGESAATKTGDRVPPKKSPPIVKRKSTRNRKLRDVGVSLVGESQDGITDGSDNVTISTQHDDVGVDNGVSNYMVGGLSEWELAATKKGESVISKRRPCIKKKKGESVLSKRRPGIKKKKGESTLSKRRPGIKKKKGESVLSKRRPGIKKKKGESVLSKRKSGIKKKKGIIKKGANTKKHKQSNFSLPPGQAIQNDDATTVESAKACSAASASGPTTVNSSADIGEDTSMIIPGGSSEKQATPMKLATRRKGSSIRKQNLKRGQNHKWKNGSGMSECFHCKLVVRGCERLTFMNTKLGAMVKLLFPYQEGPSEGNVFCMACLQLISQMRKTILLLKERRARNDDSSNGSSGGLNLRPYLRPTVKEPVVKYHCAGKVVTKRTKAAPLGATNPLHLEYKRRPPKFKAMVAASVKKMIRNEIKAYGRLPLPADTREFQFSWKEYVGRVQAECPLFHAALMGSLTFNSEAEQKQVTKKKKEVLPILGMIISTILHQHRPLRFNQYQNIATLQLNVAGLGGRKVTSRLNRLGLSMSHQAGERFQAKELELIKNRVCNWREAWEKQAEKDQPDGIYTYTLCYDDVQRYTWTEAKKRNTLRSDIITIACMDRIPPDPGLSEVPPSMEDIRSIPLHAFLPSRQDVIDDFEERKLIISRVLTKWMACFLGLRENTMKAIEHRYSKESATKTETAPLGMSLPTDAGVMTEANVATHLAYLQKFVPRRGTAEDTPPSQIVIFGDALGCRHVMRNADHPETTVDNFVPTFSDFHKNVTLLQDAYKELFSESTALVPGTLANLKNLFECSKAKEAARNALKESQELLELATEAYILAAALDYLHLDKLDDVLPWGDGDPNADSFMLSDVSEYIARLSCKTRKLESLVRDVGWGQTGKHRRKKRYCLCNGEEEALMVECKNPKCRYGKWFHLECLRLREDELPKGEKPWYCSSKCEEQGKESEGGENSTSVESAAVDHLAEYTKAILHHGITAFTRQDAIRENDGPRMIRHWKYDMLRLFAHGNHKKLFKLAHSFLRSVEGGASERVTHQLTWSRTANPTGKPGGNIGMNEHIIHYKELFKDAYKLSATHSEDAKIQEHGVLMMGLGDTISAIFGDKAEKGVSKEEKKKSRVAMKKVVEKLCGLRVCQNIPGRYHLGFTDFQFDPYQIDAAELKESLTLQEPVPD